MSVSESMRLLSLSFAFSRSLRSIRPMASLALPVQKHSPPPPRLPPPLPDLKALPALPTDLPNSVPNTDFDRCRLDAFRVAAANHLANSLSIPIETAFGGVDLANAKTKADFTVAVPRFRLKEKPAELVKRIVEGVSAHNLLHFLTLC